MFPCAPPPRFVALERGTTVDIYIYLNGKWFSVKFALLRSVKNVFIRCISLVSDHGVTGKKEVVLRRVGTLFSIVDDLPSTSTGTDRSCHFRPRPLEHLPCFFSRNFAEIPVLTISRGVGFRRCCSPTRHECWPRAYAGRSPTVPAHPVHPVIYSRRANIDRFRARAIDPGPHTRVRP